MEELKEQVHEMAADSSNDPAYTRTLELCLRQGHLELTYQEAHVALLKQLGLLQVCPSSASNGFASLCLPDQTKTVFGSPPC